MKKEIYLLAIETSCDECSASVVTESSNVTESLNATQCSASVKVLSNIIFSQAKLHEKYGGVVPEIASRNHLDQLSAVIDEALEKANIKFSDLAAVAVTNQPGLIGALLVGVSYAKTLAYALQIPLVVVNHLQGHLHSLFIEAPGKKITKKQLPLLICLASGGHTIFYLVHKLPPEDLNLEKITESRDDAAGEVFDKCAKLLGLPYPGGKHLDELSRLGNPKAFCFPRPMLKENLELSFSGIKTAVALELKSQGFNPHIFGKVNSNEVPQKKVLFDFSASIQEAIVDTLVKKICLAIEKTNAKSLAIVGGVSANSRFKQLLAQEVSLPLFFPDSEYCTDNAAMIGVCGFFKYKRGEVLTGTELLKCNAFAS